MAIISTPTEALLLFVAVQTFYAISLHSLFSGLPGCDFLGRYFGIEPNAQETFGGDWLAFGIFFWVALPILALTAVNQPAVKANNADALKKLTKLCAFVIQMIFVIQAMIITSGSKSAGGHVPDGEMLKALLINLSMIFVFSRILRTNEQPAFGSSPYPPFKSEGRARGGRLSLGPISIEKDSKAKTALFVVAIVFNLYIVYFSVCDPTLFNSGYFDPPVPRTSSWQYFIMTCVMSNLVQWFALTYGDAADAAILCKVYAFATLFAEWYENTEGGGSFIPVKAKEEDSYVNILIFILCAWGAFSPYSSSKSEKLEDWQKESPPTPKEKRK